MGGRYVATTIRLTRLGKKKRPFYRLVVLDSRKRRDGAYLANLGYYNPFVEPHEVKLHHDEIMAWLRKGATLSGTARSLLKQEGLLYRWSLEREGLEPAQIEVKMTEWQQGADARVARQEQAKKDAAAKVAAEKAAAEKAAEEEAAAQAAAEKAAEEEAVAKAAAEKAAEEEAAAAESAESAESEEAAEEAPAEDTADESQEKTDGEG
jgi:small subunit ribosomal protein S16